MRTVLQRTSGLSLFFRISSQYFSLSPSLLQRSKQHYFFLNKRNQQTYLLVSHIVLNWHSLHLSRCRLWTLGPDLPSSHGQHWSKTLSILAWRKGDLISLRDTWWYWVCATNCFPSLWKEWQIVTDFLPAYDCVLPTGFFLFLAPGVVPVQLMLTQ